MRSEGEGKRKVFLHAERYKFSDRFPIHTPERCQRNLFCNAFFITLVSARPTRRLSARCAGKYFSIKFRMLRKLETKKIKKKVSSLINFNFPLRRWETKNEWIGDVCKGCGRRREFILTLLLVRVKVHFYMTVANLSNSYLPTRTGSTIFHPKTSSLKYCKRFFMA